MTSTITTIIQTLDPGHVVHDNFQQDLWWNKIMRNLTTWQKFIRRGQRRGRGFRLQAPSIVGMTSDDRIMGQSYLMLGSLVKNGFYKDSCGDRRDGYIVNGTSESEHWCSSCRNRRPVEGCPICNIDKGVYPLSEYGSVQWREDFNVIANAYPYLPNHLLLVTREHRTQDYIFDDGVFQSMCEFFEAFMFSGTMFFNHFAGNSLSHFHVHHTTRSDFVILNKIRSGIEQISTEYENVKIVDDGKCFRAIVLFGRAALTLGGQILRNIFQQSLFVNICWLNPIEHGPSCIIFPRIATKSEIGSTELAGFILDCTGLMDIDGICERTVLTAESIQDLLV